METATLPSLGKMGEEAVEVAAVEIARVAAVELNVSTNPGGIGLLGPDRVVAHSDLGPDPVHEASERRDSAAGNCSTLPMIV